MANSYATTADGSVPRANTSARGAATLSANDYVQLEDRDLAAQAVQGREGAYRELLARYERPIFSLVFRMVRDRSLAEDLAQEAFIRAFNAIGSYNPSFKFSNWILKIANNHTIDYLRKRRLDTVSIHGSPHASNADEEARTRLVIEDQQERPDAFVENRELGDEIELAIGRLRPEYRTVVLLRHVEGYSYEEIADTLELPLGTVKTYIHRARNELKNSLAHLSP